jgi:hypothetical protein
LKVEITMKRMDRSFFGEWFLGTGCKIYDRLCLVEDVVRLQQYEGFLLSKKQTRLFRLWRIS